MLAVIFLRGEATHGALHAALSEVEDHDSDLKTLISKIRAKLNPLGIEIETIVGHGYKLKQIHRRAIKGRLTAARAAA
jgi:DNA-binding winged helix-turn-helix (wHTH) protein